MIPRHSTASRPLPPLGRAALAYARRLDLFVLPLRVAAKEPHGRLAPRGWCSATRDSRTIEEWWDRAPSANVGVACAPSGLLVVDVDPRNGGDEELGRLSRELGALPATWTVLTPGGGLHMYFRHDGSSVSGVLAAGVDIKHRGYVVAPPSVHPNGGIYRWDAGSHPLETVPAATPPTWLRRLALSPRPSLCTAASGLDARDSFLGSAFAALGWLGSELADGRRLARCPWASLHSDGRGDGADSSTILFGPRPGATLGWFACAHAHCAGRTVDDVLRALPADAIDAAARAYPDAYRSVVWRLAGSRRVSRS